MKPFVLWFSVGFQIKSKSKYCESKGKDSTPGFFCHLNLVNCNAVTLSFLTFIYLFHWFFKFNFHNLPLHIRICFSFPQTSPSCCPSANHNCAHAKACVYCVLIGAHSGRCVCGSVHTVWQLERKLPSQRAPQQWQPSSAVWSQRRCWGRSFHGNNSCTIRFGHYGC